MPSNNNIVTLNVGGRRFQTTKETIQNAEIGYFSNFLENDVNEEWFVDADPAIFVDVLYFMRHKALSPTAKSSLCRLEELKAEAEFLEFPNLLKDCTSRIQSMLHKPAARSNKAILAGDWESGNYQDLEIDFLHGEEDHVVYLVSATITGEWATPADESSAHKRGLEGNERNSSRTLDSNCSPSPSPSSSTGANTEFKGIWRNSFVGSTPTSSSGDSSSPKFVKPTLPTIQSASTPSISIEEDTPERDRSSKAPTKAKSAISSILSGTSKVVKGSTKVVTGTTKLTGKVVTGAVKGSTKVVTGTTKLTGKAVTGGAKLVSKTMNATSNAIRKGSIVNTPKNNIRKRESIMRGLQSAECFLHCNYIQSRGSENYLWNDRDLNIVNVPLKRDGEKTNIDVNRKIGVFLSRQPGYKTLTLSVSGPGEWELLYWKGPADKIPTV